MKFNNLSQLYSHLFLFADIEEHNGRCTGWEKVGRWVGRDGGKEGVEINL